MNTRLVVRSIVVVIPLVIVVATLGGAAERPLKLPLGLQEHAAFVPDDNPLTAEKVAFGKQLFWDTRWSKSGTVACVSCHRPEHGWADPRRFSINFEGKPTPRRAPAIVNRLFSDRQLWAGLRSSLEDQAKQDSNRSTETLVANLGAVPAYQVQHRRIFGRDLDEDGVARAIAAYVRTIVSGDAPYDRFVAGDRAAMSVSAQRGRAVFETKAGCVRCHVGFNFTDEGYRNIGVGMDRPTPDLGRFVVTKQDADKGAFKTPTLRDVARRAPYMHDGSLATLADVVAYYDRGGVSNPWLSSDIRALGLTAEERADLVEFLQALTGRIDVEVRRPPALP